MRYNKESGYGKYFPQRVANGDAGKIFVIGKAGLAYRDMYAEVFTPDADGRVIFCATIAAAVALGTASGADKFALMPGHTETISSSTALTMSVAGVTVYSIGTGSDRAAITLDTANTATINVTANSVKFKNVIFIANFLAIAACFTLTTAKDFVLENCEFRDTSASLNFIAIVVTNTTSNDADGLTIDGCKFFLLATSGAVKLASALGTNNRWTIQNNYYATPTTNAGAVIPIATGKILTNLLLLKNRLNLVNAAGTATGVIITTNGSTNSGYMADNQIQVATTTPLAITASSGIVQTNNLYTHTADKSGYVMPVIDASS